MLPWAPQPEQIKSQNLCKKGRTCLVTAAAEGEAILQAHLVYLPLERQGRFCQLLQTREVERERARERERERKKKERREGGEKRGGEGETQSERERERVRERERGRDRKKRGAERGASVCEAERRESRKQTQRWSARAERFHTIQPNRNHTVQQKTSQAPRLRNTPRFKTPNTKLFTPRPGAQH